MFYKISKSIDPNVIGTDSLVQAETAIYEVDFDDPLHIWKWNFEYIPDYVRIPIPKVKEKAKLTDLMSVYFTGSGGRLTVSDKLKNILYKKQHGNIQFLPITLYHKKRFISGYWLTNIINIDNDKINFKESEIYMTNYPSNEESLTSIRDYEDYKYQKELLQYPFHFYIKKVVVKSNIKEQILTIENVYGGVGYYISEKLKQEIESADCTGIEFEPVEQG